MELFKRKVLEYKIIVTVDDALDLERRVNGLIARGWEPVGGVTTFDDVLAQAMVRK